MPTPDPTPESTPPPSSERFSSGDIDGGGIVNSVTHSKAEYYQRALETGFYDASAWYVLGQAGSGIISGMTYS